MKQLPPHYLMTKEAGAFLGLSPRTLEKHRVYETGPTYRKLGGRVVYALADPQAWADRGAATVIPPTANGRPARRGRSVIS